MASFFDPPSTLVATPDDDSEKRENAARAVRRHLTGGSTDGHKATPAEAADAVRAAAGGVH
jgi:hypothetical protein